MREFILSDFIKLCKKYFILLMLMPISVVLIVYAIHFFVLPDKYQTETQIMVANNSTDVVTVEGVRANIQLIGTITSIIKSNRIMNLVEKKIDVKQIYETVTVVVDENSLILKIAVSGTDKNQAIEVANALGQVISEEIPQLFAGLGITILDEAENAKSTSIFFSLIMAFITGSLAAVMFTIGMMMFSSIIAKEEDIKELGLVVLGDVPYIAAKAKK